MFHMKQLSLREARRATGKTAAQIAELVGVSRAQLYKIEAGDCQISIATARRLRELYGSRRRVPDLAIYDPEAFEIRRANGAARSI